MKSLSLSQTDDTALTLACQRCELAIVSVLLKYGANPTVCNKVLISCTCHTMLKTQYIFLSGCFVKGVHKPLYYNCT